MQSEYIFGTESGASLFDGNQHGAAAQVAATPQVGDRLQTPLLPLDAAQVVVTPGETVVRVAVTPGEVVELPFGPDAQFVARLGDGNLAIKVGDVTVILQGYQGDNPPVIQASDGTPIDIATILAETDPNIDIQTAAGPGGNPGGQGADNTGALFQQLGGGGGLGGFDGAGGQDDTSGPGDGPGVDGGTFLRTLADTGPVNLAPAVADVAAKIDEDHALLAQQLTGTDPNGDPLTFHTTGVVPAGLTLNPDGTWSFDPTGAYDYLQKGEHATITFQYQANDGALDSNVGTVTITIDGVNDLATIVGDKAGKVKEDVTVTASGQVTVSDLDHDQAQPEVKTGVASDNGYGTWSVDAAGNWTYVLDSGNPAVNALPEGGTLTDTFTVTSLDGTASQVVTITINGTNDLPTVTGKTTGDVTEDGTIVDFGTLNVSDTDAGESHTQAQLGAAGHGFWGVDGNGNWVYLLNDLDPTVQGLHTGETLTDTFTVKTTDGTTQDVTITIHGKDDKAVMFGDTTGKVTENSGATETGTIVVFDADKGDAHTQVVNNAASSKGYGTFSVDADGHWSYKLDDTNATVNALPAGAKITDTFTVTSLDGSASKTVTVTITGANDVPTITGDTTGAVTEDSGVSAHGTLTVKDVDTNQSFTATKSGTSSYGSWSVDPAGHWTYNLDNTNADVNKLGTGDTLTDTFTVKSLDGSASEVVTITIHGHNDAPVLTGGASGVTNEDESGASFDLVALKFVTITDPDSNSFTFTADGTPPAGFSIDPNGVLHFDPAGHYDYLAAGATQVVDFKFKVSDGEADSNTITIPITISGRNDAPVITSNGGGVQALISIAENTTAVTTVHATDVDATDKLTYSISGGLDAALFNIDGATGALSFKSAPDFEHPLDNGGNNIYDVTVKVDDGHGGSDTQQIAVTVTDAAEGPSAATDYIFTSRTDLFTVDNAWLLANDKGSGLQIDSADAGGNSGFYESSLAFLPFPILISTPLELGGKTYIDLDTSFGLDDIVDPKYLNSGDKTSFTYQASDSSSATTTGTVEVTYTNAATIDRSADTHNVIIVGNAANETLKGGSGDDVISGGGGNDQIFGGDGKDLIFGDGGNDTIHYGAGDTIHGGDDSINTNGGLRTDNDRGDIVVFHNSIDLTDAQYSGKFDGIETISLKASDGATGDQNLTVNASQVLAMSNHTINPTGGDLGSEGAIRIEIDSGDKLYLSNDDGGKWFNTGQTSNGFTIFVHETDTNGTIGDHENAYVMVNTSAVANVQLNVDAP